MNTRFIHSLLFAFFAITFVVAQDTCITQPAQPTCESYQLPANTVESDIDSLCTSMPNMPGCSIEKLCTESKYESSEYCVRFSILKDICIDMPMMKGCSNYVPMCNKTANSVVKQCDTKELTLPSSMDGSSLIKSICSEMNMDGCEKCPGTGQILNCDILGVYSQLCIAMPDMEQCKAWSTMCTEIPSWSLCSSEASNTPSMKMYFHTGFLDYVLFKGWVPTTTAQYTGTWFAILIFGIMYEFLKVVRVLCEEKWNYTPDCCSTEDKGFIKRALVPFRPAVDIPRAALQSLEVFWSLLLMLIAMTYNVGLFFAIIAGSFVGTLIFGRMIPYTPKACC